MPRLARDRFLPVVGVLLMSNHRRQHLVCHQFTVERSPDHTHSFEILFAQCKNVYRIGFFVQQFLARKKDFFEAVVFQVAAEDALLIAESPKSRQRLAILVRVRFLLMS